VAAGLLTAPTAGAHGRGVAVAKAPVKVNPYNNGLKIYGYYYIRNAIQHYRVRVVVCLQVRTDSGRWAISPARALGTPTAATGGWTRRTRTTTC
jgi:hypothetical protein